MRERLGWAAGLALAGMLLVACSSDDEPGTLPDVTPSESGTSPEPPSPTASLDPTAQLEAEITEFYESYVDAINESWTSEEALARRRQMFADSCIPCLRGYELAQRAHDEGLKLEAGLGEIRRVRIDSIDGDVITFLGVEDVAAGRLVDPNGATVEEFGASIGAQVVYRAQKTADSRWVIVASDLLSVESGGPS